MTAVKPFLRWAGSKRSVVKKLAENSPSNYSRYIEPFAGSGALFFHLAPTAAVLSDLNWEVVNLFNRVKNQPEELHERLVSPTRDKDTYLKVRERFGTEEDDLVKWSGKTGQRAKMYPTLKTGYTNDETTELFRQV